MKKVSADNSSSSYTGSEGKITETSSALFQFSMRSLLGFSAFCGALAGVGSLIQRNLESTHREAHLATPNSELLITGPNTEQPGIFLTIKSSAEGVQPTARLVESYVMDACSPKARYLTALRLIRLTNSDDDFACLESLERINDLFIGDCDKLTGALLTHISPEIGSMTLRNLPNFNGDTLSALIGKSVSSIVFINTPIGDRDLAHLSQISELQMVAFTGTNCSLNAISQALKDTNVKMLTFKSTKSLYRDSDEVKLMEAWCSAKAQRTCLLIDEVQSLILKSSNDGLVETMENLPIVISPPATKL